MGLIVILPVILPIVLGSLVAVLPFKKRESMQAYVMAVVLLNTAAVFAALFLHPDYPVLALNLAGKLEVVFKIDGMGSIFAGMIAVLWPFAALYAFSYMKHYEKVKAFFTFYTMTFGVAVGIAFASNIMTLYMFYEMLTLCTLPLVTFSMRRRNVKAGRKYVSYSIGGAAFAFIGFIFILVNGSSMDFTPGGVLDPSALAGKEDLVRFIYVITVLGFGVKAAIFPFHGWLPTASIAPTPVTALLHAVAVVKAGAFAIMRVTYFSFGTDIIKGSWAQYVVLGFAIVTIIFGSCMAWKETHLKRRLAYSTISNLSYIVFGVALMTPEGLAAGLSHMLFHAFMKISLFFVAGAILTKTKKEYVYELHGIGYAMPVSMICFALSSFAVIGIPPFSGFISKWNLGSAAVAEGSVMAYLGIAALLISGLLTAVYLLKIVVLAFFPKKTEVESAKQVERNEADIKMLIPIVLFTVVSFLLGCFSAPLMEVFNNVLF